MKLFYAIICSFCCVISMIAEEQKTVEFTWKGHQVNNEPVKGWFSALGTGKKPEVKGDVIQLMNGSFTSDNHKAINVAAWKQTVDGVYSNIKGRFSFTMGKGSHGLGFALLDTKEFGKEGAGPSKITKWEEPNLAGSFAIGLDCYNPANSSWFDRHGNYYDRPQHELSIHWNGKEYYKKVTPVDFRDGQNHSVDWQVSYVSGGAEVTVKLDGKPVFESFFIAKMMSYEFRPCFGSRHGELKNDIYLTDLEVKADNRTKAAPMPLVESIFMDELVYSKNREPIAEKFLKQPIISPGRVLLTLDLKGGPGGCDPWDKEGAIYIWTEDGERFELARFVTPYGKEYSWDYDVTDFLPLLEGKCKFGIYIDTWMPETEKPSEQKGWKVSVMLSFYKGENLNYPLEIHNLWNGKPDLGNPKKPLEKFFTSIEHKVPAWTTAAKLRFNVTGHGMAYKNAGEFYALSRTVKVNGKEFKNLLWKTDCYLNPCRPQGGSWKFDRAGWAPGDKVRTWEIDVTDIVQAGKKVKIEYLPEPFENKQPDKWCHHWVESQIVYYMESE